MYQLTRNWLVVLLSKTMATTFSPVFRSEASDETFEEFFDHVPPLHDRPRVALPLAFVPIVLPTFLAEESSTVRMVLSVTLWRLKTSATVSDPVTVSPSEVSVFAEIVELVQSMFAAWTAPKASAAKAAVRSVRFIVEGSSYRPRVAAVGMGRKDVPVADASYVVVGYLPNDTDTGTR